MPARGVLDLSLRGLHRAHALRRRVQVPLALPVGLVKALLRLCQLLVLGADGVELVVRPQAQRCPRALAVRIDALLLHVTLQAFEQLVTQALLLRHKLKLRAYLTHIRLVARGTLLLERPQAGVVVAALLLQGVYRSLQLGLSRPQLLAQVRQLILESRRCRARASGRAVRRGGVPLAIGVGLLAWPKLRRPRAGVAGLLADALCEQAVRGHQLRHVALHVRRPHLQRPDLLHERVRLLEEGLLEVAEEAPGVLLVHGANRGLLAAE
mmetsp:Transcript_64789/g.166766  ORF Transcript_64789/g.166766 Transcript_64789/m.166766 type:complete len:267 (+) Transcript_64789:581-1381(+)